MHLDSLLRNLSTRLTTRRGHNEQKVFANKQIFKVVKINECEKDDILIRCFNMIANERRRKKNVYDLTQLVNLHYLKSKHYIK